MTHLQQPDLAGRSGCVRSLCIEPEFAVYLEELRVRSKKKSIEALLREALCDLAQSNGIPACRDEPTDIGREQLPMGGKIERPPGTTYVDLVLFYHGKHSWPEELAQKLQCNAGALMILAAEAAAEKLPQ